ncbi:fimbrial protein [Citrobacter amalonaticus]|uniref:fimbrial protein n=1 Tax=Citrobacter amalonaticus TaxID=35703 RepID=UPI001A1D5D1B|nr:fimbrial protein [Citrobacter amalonaticus]MDT7076058.1 fimbrial protein [Citrobacter amalonaticus]HAU5638876.1 fimbrial protein [Citrobacter amalonaticus]HDQ2814327.1 fimbrial protein [Citrobacter amalonaticus]
MRALYSVTKYMILIFAFSILSMVKAFACYADGSDKADAHNHIYNVSLNDVIVQRDAPVGTTVLTQSISTGLSDGGVFAYCYTGDKAHYLLKGESVVAVSGYDHVYETNVPGIGITIEGGDSGRFYSNPSYDKASTGNYQWAWSNWGTSFEITLVKTGPISSGNINGITAVMSAAGLGDLLTLNINAGKVTTLACSINTPTIRAPLGNVVNSSFTGVGSMPKSFDFDVGLECDAGANINVSLEGAQSSETSDTSVLALTDAGQPDVASGVGVQIVYGSKPLKLNENIVLGKAEGGHTLFALTARYYQTKTTVKNGAANATATLNITYQ